MFTLEKKTGFLNTGNDPIILTDSRGLPFYDTSKIQKRVEKFNLPIGKYNIISGIFQPLNSPVKYRLYPLPKLEREMVDPFEFEISFGDNPSKCSVFWNEGKIIFDEKMKALTRPELAFILFHEFGHKMFDSEKGADFLAANLMLIRGYNPYQIASAPITSLSERQKVRKNNIVNLILNKL